MLLKNNQIAFYKINLKTSEWLQESCNALYEASTNKDDPKMLNEFIENLKMLLRQGAKDSVYLNYYGYTLIDKNIDPKRV